MWPKNQSVVNKHKLTVIVIVTNHRHVHCTCLATNLDPHLIDQPIDCLTKLGRLEHATLDFYSLLDDFCIEIIDSKIAK